MREAAAPPSVSRVAPHRLRTGHGPWAVGVGEPAWSRAPESFKTDVAIVGAGITGSLMAQHLTAMGRSVAVIDRLAPGQGSTAASTAMLQWEIDRSLSELADAYGFEKAAKVYRQSLAAVSGLGDLVAATGVACDWRTRSAVFLAADGAGETALDEEFKARDAAGLPSEHLTGAAVRGRLGLNRQAALVSTGEAEADPVKLSHGMLTLARAAGARLIHEEVAAYAFGPQRATLGLSSGIEIEAAQLVLATGYTLPPFVTAPCHEESASWAAVTGPGMNLGFWEPQSLIWEDDEPYLYMRTTADGRILVGGEDEKIDDPAERDRLSPQKAATLHGKLEKLWGMAMPPFESVWSAAFGETKDGLPLIGRLPGHANVFCAYGYGGNGITYSFLASRLIGALMAGEERDWFEMFAVDRSGP